MVNITRRSFVGWTAASAALPGFAHAKPLSSLEIRLAVLALIDGSTLTFGLSDVMKAAAVPALSLAVISGYEVVETPSWGIGGVGESSPVTDRTLFQAASISKPVTATGALALVQNGLLSLDGNVNEKLTAWQVPENALTVREKVTLRRLLSHTAGLNVHGFPGYSIDSPLPSLAQILDGLPPANTAPVRVVFEPGSRQEYSGGGTTVEQLLMCDATDRQFEDLMQETVLGPMGMTDSTFALPLTADTAALAAAGTTMDGKLVPGRWHQYPEKAAAGLWTTPRDLARFAATTAKARLGRFNPVLSVTTMQEMFRKVPNGDVLGFFGDPLNPGVFQHNGGNVGFRSLLIMNGDTGNGVTLMANADGGWGLIELASQCVGQFFGWKHDFGGPQRAVWLVAITHGADMALSHFEAIKSTAQEEDLNLAGRMVLARGRTEEAIRLYRRNVEAYPQSGNVYDSLAWAYEVAGEATKAVENYRMSLERNPANANAAERLKALAGTT